MRSIGPNHRLTQRHSVCRVGNHLHDELVGQAHDGLAAPRDPALLHARLVRAVRLKTPHTPVGRFDDIGEDGISELANVVACIQNYDWTGKNVDDEVEIITASVRTPNHVTQAALMGADIATVPFGALKKCLKHPLTDQGMASFDADWAKVVAAQ